MNNYRVLSLDLITQINLMSIVRQCLRCCGVGWSTGHSSSLSVWHTDGHHPHYGGFFHDSDYSFWPGADGHQETLFLRHQLPRHIEHLAGTFSLFFKVLRCPWNFLEMPEPLSCLKVPTMALLIDEGWVARMWNVSSFIILFIGVIDIVAVLLEGFLKFQQTDESLSGLSLG